MSKIICEICGTQYADTAECCPICGWKKSQKQEDAFAPAVDAGVSDEFDLGFLDSEIKEDKPAGMTDNGVDIERFPKEKKAAPVVLPNVKKSKKEAFDFDAVNADKPARPAKRVAKPAPVEEKPQDDDEEEEEESRSNPFLVILLVLLIVALLATSGFIFWKYYLNGGSSDDLDDFGYVETADATEPESEETTVPTVPCTGLSLVSGIDTLTAEGQFWLLHVKASPEDTTDIITYSSADSSIATVTEEGRVTALQEGETKIVIVCGDQTIEAPVVVRFEEEETTVPEETEAETVEDNEESAETEATEAEEEEEEDDREIDPNVVLKLKKTDLTFGIRGVYTTLVLDCDLEPSDVTFTSRNTNVATVNAKGEVTAAGPGLTVITVTYGKQSVECIIRCNF